MMISRISAAKNNEDGLTVSWIMDGTSQPLIFNVLLENNGVCTNIGADYKAGSYTITGIDRDKEYSVQIRSFDGISWENTEVLEIA